MSALHHGDCLEVMAEMEPESVDAVVTDPPYNLTADTAGWRGKTGNDFNGRPDLALRRGGFMGKAWDGTGIAFKPETWEAAYRVAKPSAYLLAFGGTRTVHRLTSAIEDAGWIIRDMLVWAYASGFPKSKASLKPAWEPIVMARKPGPLRTLAIDACRIPMTADDAANIDSKHAGMDVLAYERPVGTSLHLSAEPMPLQAAHAHEAGRWPANVILTDPIFDGSYPDHSEECRCPCHEDEAAAPWYGSRRYGCRRCTDERRWEGVVGGGISESGGRSWVDGDIETSNWRSNEGRTDSKVRSDYQRDGDSGTYSRFFLVPKADRGDREPVLGGLPTKPSLVYSEKAQGPLPQQTPAVPSLRQNVHPTVKPTELMRHLVRLVTPTGGIVLDPFLGSGTTALAAEMEGFEWIGIEKEAEYVAIAEARLNGTQRGLGLPA